MLPTPDTRHVDVSRVYEPAEDSFLLLDVLASESEATFLHTRFGPDSVIPLVLEVGTGSGVVLAFIVANARHILGCNDVLAFGIDVNHYACSAARSTIQTALPNDGTSHVIFDIVRSDLLSNMKSASVDILVFNPPYVPTESVPDSQEPTESSEDIFDEQSRLLELSYAGGSNGMAVTSRFLDQLPIVLSARGVAYLLLCAQNKPRQIVQQLEEGGSLQARMVGSSGKTGGWEKLCILRITHRGS